MTKREVEQHAAAVAAAYDLGREYYGEEPDHLLVTVARMASSLYAPFPIKDNELAFLHGYQQARAKREEYLREQGR